jgi:protein TonB
MRAAAAASIAIHLGLIVGAWAVMSSTPPVDELAAESVSVDIISIDAFSEQPSETATATNQNLVSAGAEQEAMEVPETAEVEWVELAAAEPMRPVEQQVAVAVPEIVEQNESEELVSAVVMTATAVTETPLEGAAPQVMDAAAALVADSVAPSASDPLDAVRTATLAALAPEVPVQQTPEALARPAEPIEAIEAIETAALAPAIEETIEEVVPVPQPRIVRRPVEAKAEPVKTPAKKPVEPQKKPPSKQASLGNGGNAEADSAASKTSGGGQGKQNNGGSAAVSRYPGLVQSKVARAAKRPRGSGGGEAHVSFTVNASGNVTRVALARSSGDASVDEAALTAVNRAAPFPPIPADAGRSTWQFTVPIYFKK